MDLGEVEASLTPHWPFIHRIAWKGNSRKSRKFGCRILYRETRALPITLLGVVLRTGSDYDILDERIKMCWREYIALSYS